MAHITRHLKVVPFCVFLQILIIRSLWIVVVQNICLGTRLQVKTAPIQIMCTHVDSTM